ncbi:MAG: hypothetical protein LJF04_06140 [Gemmatimonadetes bacterium]|nr:hypothetical protein [Gemmatimonadota bacterium]
MAPWFARTEDFVPALAGSDARHRFIERVRNIEFARYPNLSRTAVLEAVDNFLSRLSGG